MTEKTKPNRKIINVTGKAVRGAAVWTVMFLAIGVRSGGVDGPTKGHNK